MNKIFTFILLLVICYNGQAQSKLQHQPKMHRNEKGRLFVNKHQPMYLFLGTDPNNKPKAEKLTSEATAKYANPFYFDTEGKNTVRTPSKVDPVTKQVIVPRGDVIFEVYADGIAPRSLSRFFGAPIYIKNGTTYYGKGLKMDLKVKDQVSGVENTYISVDGVDFADYSGEKSFFNEKEYSVKYYSVDFVGNDEKISEKKFQTDTTAPVVMHKFEGDVYGKYISGKSKIILSATDNITGVKRVTYQFDEGQKKAYFDAISASTLSNGEHKIKYWGVDFVKNKSVTNTNGDFIVDKIGPDVECKVLGDQYKGRYHYVSNRSTLQLTAEDSQSGVKLINYGFASSEINSVYSTPFKFIDKLGLQKVYFNATDNVENKSSRKEKLVYLDNEAPISAIDYIGPQFFARDTLFVNKYTKVKLFSKDKASGVQLISYEIEGSPMTYDKAFHVEKDGHHKLLFYAKDNVNNVEKAKNSEIFVDNIGPDIYINFSIKPIRTENVDGKELNVYPPYVKMYLGATDKSCGTKKILYSIDGGKMKSYTSPNSPSNVELFTKQQTHAVVVKAVDELGNKTEKQISFVVAEK
ncbi:MAG: OmpL47-type beta-barrel domain-containing protein [Bacteroidales bacterium]